MWKMLKYSGDLLPLHSTSTSPVLEPVIPHTNFLNLHIHVAHQQWKQYGSWSLAVISKMAELQIRDLLNILVASNGKDLDQIL